MTTRTNSSIAQFSHTFSLAGIDGVQPAGDYRIDTDEELIEGISRIAWRRVATYMHLPAQITGGQKRQMVTIDFDTLEIALKLDREREATAGIIGKEQQNT